MAYTSHGQHIPGTDMDDRLRVVYRCGGPVICMTCALEVSKYNHPTNSPKKEESMSNLLTTQYQRKPFFVDAVQVTPENLPEVAKWCNGDVRYTNDEPDMQNAYVKVRVHRPLNERQTRAFVGDWVLYAGTGYKVYTDPAFKKCFDKSEVAAEV